MDIESKQCTEYDSVYFCDIVKGYIQGDGIKEGKKTYKERIKPTVLCTSFC